LGCWNHGKIRRSGAAKTATNTNSFFGVADLMDDLGRETKGFTSKIILLLSLLSNAHFLMVMFDLS